MTAADLQFLIPAWLWLLPLLWFYLIAWFRVKKSTKTNSVADASLHANNHFYHPLTQQLSEEAKLETKDNLQESFLHNPKFWWQGLALSSLIVSLAQPVLIGERQPDPPPERDIIFLVDTSLSMQLKDYSLDGTPIKRMDLLKNLLNDFTTKMAGESISVILFAEKPFMLVPLSNDENLIRRMLNRVTTTLAGRYTAVGDALLMALKESNKQPERHQTFIVFTDADDSRGKVTPIAVAKLVAESDIPVFTIAIGSSQKDKNNEVQGGLYQAVNLSLLKNIADITRGESYQVHDSKAIEQALQNILKQRQNMAEIVPIYERETLYLYPLLLGLFILVLWQVLRLIGTRYV